MARDGNVDGDLIGTITRLLGTVLDLLRSYALRILFRPYQRTRSGPGRGSSRRFRNNTPKDAACLRSVVASLKTSGAQQAFRYGQARIVGLMIHQAITSGCPVDTGRLRASLEVDWTIYPGDVTVDYAGCRSLLTRGRVTYHIQTNVHYAPHAYPKADNNHLFVGVTALAWADIYYNFNF